MKEFVAIARALSDPGRLRALCALRGGELCVCQLISLLELAPSTVSKHLSVLNQAGLVDSRKQGRWVYYRLPDEPVSPVAAGMTAETFRALADDEQIRRDEARLEAIRGADLEVLCRETAGRD